MRNPSLHALLLAAMGPGQGFLASGRRRAPAETRPRCQRCRKHDTAVDDGGHVVCQRDGCRHRSKRPLHE